jgi:hypothetical protein
MHISCDDNPSVCRHLVDTGAIASLYTIVSQPAAPTVRALGACVIASAVGPTPDALAVLLLVLQAAFSVKVVDSSLELCSRLAAQVLLRARIRLPSPSLVVLRCVASECASARA